MSKFVISKDIEGDCLRVLVVALLAIRYMELWRGRREDVEKSIKKIIFVIKQFVLKGFNFGYFLIFYDKPKLYVPPLSQHLKFLAIVVKISTTFSTLYTIAPFKIVQRNYSDQMYLSYIFTIALENYSDQNVYLKLQ